MATLLAMPTDRIAVVPLGINLTGYERRRPGKKPAGGRAFRVGYFARVAPEKGLRALADAYVELRRRTGDAPIRLDAAGYLSRAHESYLEDVRDRLDKAGLANEFTYHGAVDRSGKLAFLRSSTCCRCRQPTTSRKACFCSRRWRAACRSCSRAAARSPRSSRGPAAASSSRQIKLGAGRRAVHAVAGPLAHRETGRPGVRRGARALQHPALGRSYGRGLRTGDRPSCIGCAEPARCSLIREIT